MFNRFLKLILTIVAGLAITACIVTTPIAVAIDPQVGNSISEGNALTIIREVVEESRTPSENNLLCEFSDDAKYAYLTRFAESRSPVLMTDLYYVVAQYPTGTSEALVTAPSFGFGGSLIFCNIRWTGDDANIKSVTPEEMSLMGSLLTSLGVKLGEGVATEHIAALDLIKPNDEFTYENGGKYIGPTMMGEAHGQGIYYYADGGRLEGQFKNGQAHGPATIYANNSRFEGAFVNGERRGPATWYYDNGDIINGTYESNELVIPATKTRDNGSTLTGNLRGGFLNGEGTETSADNIVYQGNFDKDVKNGNFITTYPNGRSYAERWNNGKMVHQAPTVDTIQQLAAAPKCRLANPKWVFMEGGCEAGFAQGEAEVVSLDAQQSFKGSFNQGRPQSGIITTADGGHFEGPVDNFQLNGQGLHAINGAVDYQGAFLNGLRHGDGSCLFEDIMEACSFEADKRTDLAYITREAIKYQQTVVASCNANFDKISSFQDTLAYVSDDLCQGKMEWVHEEFTESVECLNRNPDEPIFCHMVTRDNGWEIANSTKSCLKKKVKQINDKSESLMKYMGKYTDENCNDVLGLVMDRNSIEGIASSYRNMAEDRLDELYSIADQYYELADYRNQLLAQQQAAFNQMLAQDWQNHLAKRSAEFDNLFAELNQQQKQMHEDIRAHNARVAEQRAQHKAKQQQIQNASNISNSTVTQNQVNISGSNVTINNTDPFEAIRIACENSGDRWDSNRKACIRAQQNHQVNIQLGGTQETPTSSSSGAQTASASGGTNAPMAIDNGTLNQPDFKPKWRDISDSSSVCMVSGQISEGDVVKAYIENTCSYALSIAYCHVDGGTSYTCGTDEQYYPKTIVNFPAFDRRPSSALPIGGQYKFASCRKHPEGTKLVSSSTSIYKCQIKNL